MQYDNETKKLIEQLDKQAKEILAKIDELKNSNKPKNVRWRAEKGGWYVNGSGYTKKECNNFASASDYEHGQYFKTDDDYKKYKNNLIITQKLKDIALRLNNGVEIDWSNKQEKYFITYSHDRKQLELEIRYENKSTNTYCLSDKFLETAIKEIGEKELIEYIKNS